MPVSNNIHCAVRSMTRGVVQGATLTFTEHEAVHNRCHTSLSFADINDKRRALPSGESTEQSGLSAGLLHKRETAYAFNTPVLAM
jgi:hypothetical protein